MTASAPELTVSGSELAHYGLCIELSEAHIASMKADIAASTVPKKAEVLLILDDTRIETTFDALRSLSAPRGDWSAGIEAAADKFAELMVQYDGAEFDPALIEDEIRALLPTVEGERDALLLAKESVVDALRMAVRQNSHDMLMTGEQIRRCEAALAPEQAGEDANKQSNAAPQDGGTDPLPQVMGRFNDRVWEGAAPSREALADELERQAGDVIGSRYFFYVTRAEFQSIIAALRAPAGVQAWLPIDPSVPAGRYLVCADTDDGPFVCEMECNKKGQWEYQGQFTFQHSFYIKPTDYQPLPPPPSSEGSEK